MTCVFAPLLNSHTDSSPNLCECHLQSGQQRCVVEGTDNPLVRAPPVAPPTGALTDVLLRFGLHSYADTLDCIISFFTPLH